MNAQMLLGIAVRAAPHLLEELAMGHRPARVDREHPQELPFYGSEMDRRAAPTHGAPGQLDQDTISLDPRVAVRLLGELGAT